MDGPATEALTNAHRIALIDSVSDSSQGVCIYLTPEDLRALGVDPTTSDEIAYSIDMATAQLTVTGHDEE